MVDTIELTIGGKTYTKVTSYAIDSDIYNAAGSFRVGMHPSYMAQINCGDRCTIKINGSTVLTGLVDAKPLSGDKNSLQFSVTGRDLMGLIVDYHIESFRTIKNKTLYQVAEMYLRQIDYVKQLNITYLDGSADLDVAQDYVQPQPGMTVFELLSGIAAARGMHFYMRPDGNLVFGKPRGSGQESFAVWRTADGNSNVLSFDYNEDLSQQYSRVTVVGQAQSTLDTGISDINKKAIATDAAFPFVKPLVVETDTAAKTPAQQARMILEQQRLDGFKVQYTVSGHTQRGRLWAPDTICAVDDYRIPLRGEFVVYRRTFKLDKKEKSTTIVLGKMGEAK